MRKILYILMAVGLISCDSFVELEPKGSVIPSTVDDLANIIMTSNAWGTNNMHVGVSNQTFFDDNGELPYQPWNSDFLVSAYTFQDDIIKNNFDGRDGVVENYKAIYLVNYVLENIETFPEGDNKYFPREEVKGSALFYRALNHFLIVNQNAEHYKANSNITGVPLRLESNVNKPVSLANVEDIYSQVLLDLEESLDMLPDEAEYYLPSKQAALALLARVYLYMGDYEKAAANAELALDINSELFDYNIWMGGMIPPSMREWEFEDIIFFKRGGFSVQYRPLVEENLYNSFADADIRKTAFFRTSYAVQGRYEYQFSVPINIGLDKGVLYLTQMESLLRKPSPDEVKAKALLTEYLPKRYSIVPDVSGLTGTDLLSFIMDERRKETCTMGSRLFDIKRLNALEGANISVDHTYNAETFTKQVSDKWAFPFPVILEKDLVTDITMN